MELQLGDNLDDELELQQIISSRSRPRRVVFFMSRGGLRGTSARNSHCCLEIARELSSTTCFSTNTLGSLNLLIMWSLQRVYPCPPTTTTFNPFSGLCSPGRMCVPSSEGQGERDMLIQVSQVEVVNTSSDLLSRKTSPWPTRRTPTPCTTSSSSCWPFSI